MQPRTLHVPRNHYNGLRATCLGAANLAALMRPSDTPREPRAWERAGYADPDAYELIELDPWAMPSDWSDGLADELDSIGDDQLDEEAEVYALETAFYRDAA